jgi:hypothetical protein
MSEWKPIEAEDGERWPWCYEFDAHASAHRFCVDHQANWCFACDGGQCPECVDDPHCRYCHCALNEEYHDWDCAFAGDEDCE